MQIPEEYIRLTINFNSYNFALKCSGRIDDNNNNDSVVDNVHCIVGCNLLRIIGHKTGNVDYTRVTMDSKSVKISKATHKKVAIITLVPGMTQQNLFDEALEEYVEKRPKLKKLIDDAQEVWNRKIL